MSTFGAHSREYPSDQYNSYLQVRIGRQVVLASVDSGNGIPKAISCDLAKKLKIREHLKYHGPLVGTVKKGQPLSITRVLKNIKNIILQMMDSLGATNDFKTLLLIIKDLSSRLSILEPWLHLMKIDQIHSQGCLHRASSTFQLYTSIDMPGNVSFLQSNLHLHRNNCLLYPKIP